LPAAPPSVAQLTLPLHLPAAAGFERFVADGNDEPLAAVRAWCRGDGSPVLFLHGAAASGKTHLLQAAAADLATAGRGVVYVPLDQAGVMPAMLEDLERLDAVVLDAVEAVAGRRDWEEALFHLYNRLQARGRRQLVAARLPAALLPLTLPDLRSRLSAAPAYALRALDDAGRARLLRRGAEQRGLRLGDAVVAYVLSRCPRDPAWLVAFLDLLDQATLAEQRAPTVRFVGRLLDTLGGRPDSLPS
jgi:DnaA family protein